MSSGMKPSIWGFSSAGRALAWHARGHRFDPGNLHQKEKHCTGMCGAFLLCLPSYAAAKFMLDICGKLWYNPFCNCGYSTSASISAFQAEEVGSIPIARSTKNRLDSLESGRFSYSIAPLFTSPLFHSHDNAPSKIFEEGVVMLYSYGRSLTSRSSSAAQTRRRPEWLSSFLCAQYAHIMLTS